MALPLPQVVSDVGPGGRIVTTMRGINALAADNLANQIKGVEAQYAPLTTQAEAASKLAYANLMGPQFLAKLMGNPDVVANSPLLQDPRTTQMLYEAGSGQGTGNALTNIPTMQNANSSNSLSGWIMNKIKGIVSPSQTSNPFAQGQATNINAITETPDNSEVGQATTAWLKSPEAQALAEKNGMYTIPDANQLIPWYRSQQGSIPSSAAPNSTYAENAGTYRGTIEEGKEAGKIRAQDIKELNDTVFNADTKLATLDDINNMISSAEIRQIRELPAAGRHELAYYSKFGTPKQQQLVGRLYAQMGNIVKDSSRDFAGQFRKGEQQLLQGMKPNDSDTVDSMIGKSESLTVMTKLLRERAALTAKLMNQYHMNKGQAQEIADQQIKGNEIRNEVHDKLNPTVTIKNSKTGELITVPVSEARSKYGVNPNV